MQEQFVKIFPRDLREKVRKAEIHGLEEIRVRIGWPVEFLYGNRSEWLGSYDCMMDRNRLDEMLNYITGYSVYAMEEELRQGFLPMKGGHRIGITGHAAYDMFPEGGMPRVKNLTDIGGLNIRIAHERKGCAKELLSHLRNGPSIYNTLFLAAPGGGKTTYLRDVIRLLSTGDEEYEGLKCCVIDERSEIAACVNGKPQNDLGKRCDVLDACPKLIGMKMVLRSMSPEVIAVDELGKAEEFVMLEEMCYSGVRLLGTLHAGEMKDALHNPLIQDAVKKDIIQRFVELKKLPNGSRQCAIYDVQGELLWKNM